MSDALMVAVVFLLSAAIGAMLCAHLSRVTRAPSELLPARRRPGWASVPCAPSMGSSPSRWRASRDNTSSDDCIDGLATGRSPDCSRASCCW